MRGRNYSQPFVLEQAPFNGKEIHLVSEKNVVSLIHDKPVLSVIVYPPLHLISSSDDERIRKFDIRTCKCLESTQPKEVFSRYRLLIKMSSTSFFGVVNSPSTEEEYRFRTDKVVSFSAYPLKEEEILVESKKHIYVAAKIDDDTFCLFLIGNEIVLYSISQKKKKSVIDKRINWSTVIRRSKTNPSFVYFSTGPIEQYDGKGIAIKRLDRTSLQVEEIIKPKFTIKSFEVFQNSENDEVVVFADTITYYCYNTNTKSIEWIEWLSSSFQERIISTSMIDIGGLRLMLLGKQHPEGEIFEIILCNKNVKEKSVLKMDILRDRHYTGSNYGTGFVGIQLADFIPEKGVLKICGHHRTRDGGEPAPGRRSRRHHFSSRIITINGFHLYDRKEEMEKEDFEARTKYFLGFSEDSLFKIQVDCDPKIIFKVSKVLLY